MDFSKFLTPFEESHIEWRLAQCGKKNDGGVWGTCLAYIQARAIMDRLDEVAGPEYWKAEYSFIGTAGVICKLSIKCGGEWVTKEDGAEQTDIESFKGGISSALKRAAVLWGIGRYLYDLESGFIQEVTKGAPGARYGKTKDGAQFYWVPPKLPAWALPPSKNAHPSAPSPIKPKTGPHGMTLEMFEELRILCEDLHWPKDQVIKLCRVTFDKAEPWHLSPQECDILVQHMKANPPPKIPA